jgi:hypothetical protein
MGLNSKYIEIMGLMKFWKVYFLCDAAHGGGRAFHYKFSLCCRKANVIKLRKECFKPSFLLAKERVIERSDDRVSKY